jgi:hypothetical protein
MIRQRKLNFTVRPPSESSSSGDDAVDLKRPHKARKVNIYDAVAGKQYLQGIAMDCD